MKNHRLFKMFLLVGIMGWVLAIGNALANDYYVAPNGSDKNSGSIDSPWATLDYAVTKGSAPGDTIYLRAGTYAGVGDIGYGGATCVVDPSEGGAPEKIKTITNYPNEDVYITSTIKSYVGYMKFEGLHFINGASLALGAGVCDYDGIQSDFQAINNTFSGTPPEECIFSNSDNVLIEGNTCDIQGNSKGTQGHGFYISTGENIIVRNNVIKGMTGYGAHVFD